MENTLAVVFDRQLLVKFNSMHKPPALYNGNVLQYNKCGQAQLVE